jgi:hypothetical protein
MNNQFNINFATPYQRVALCLTYIARDRVANWVRTQMRWLYEVTSWNVNPVLPTNQWLWDTFEEEFNYTFKDMTAEQRAEKKLADLRMAPNELDIYITNFKDLVRQAGRHPDDKGTLLMFRKGLPRGLNKAIFDHHPRPPTSLRALMQLAHDQHHNWLTFVTHFGTGGKKNKGQMRDRARNYRQRNNQPDDAMDVDSIAANALTTEEKADCLKKGLCFFCKKSGHMTRNCPKK